MHAISERPLLVSVPEAARLLGIPRNRAYLWCRQGLLPHARDGHKIRVPVRALERLADKIEAGEWPGSRAS